MSDATGRGGNIGVIGGITLLDGGEDIAGGVTLV